MQEFFAEQKNAAGTENRAPGRLKIFFGYAAGVGKTFAMLEAAHQAKKEGVDVVAGYVEPHARPDTLALLNGLEALPCREMGYRGIKLREFDLDGALKRRPQLILVDELAHNNAPGCRHTKRYQDVEELLAAGINVHTTVNVQHLESLNDLVSSITGIAVSERIPDRIFDRADQVELVDIEPGELVKRLQAGKVYRERQAKQALQNFFSAENLAALREIAMRRTADQLNRAALSEGKEKSARAGEHILICLSSAPSNAKVIRTAARMAEAFHSGFTALFVQTPETKELSGENLKRLRGNLRLAEQLGAQISTVYGADPAVQIAEYARVSGVTKIVMGRVNHKQNPLTGKKSLADRLIELTDLDVYIIPDRQPLYKKSMAKLRLPKPRFTWKDTGIMFASLALSSLAGFGFYRAGFSESNIITVYILGVLLTAVWTTECFYGAAASLLSVAAFNFFFTEPRYTFQANDPSYPVTFLIMLFSSVIAGTLAGRVKTQAREEAQKSYYTELLLGSSQKLQAGRTEWDCLRLTAEQLNRLFGRPVLYALNEAEEELSFRVEPADETAVLAGLGSEEPEGSSFLEFTAQTRMSGVDLPDGTRVRKGACDAIEQHVRRQGGTVPADLHTHVEKVSSLGGTPLVVCENDRILGVIYLKDTVKPGMAERFERLRAIGIKTIMCTGDNPLTAATIAKEAGVDGFVAECKPEDKIRVIKQEQAEGKIVAMTGDGTNDAPALAQANVGLAMNSGTTAAKEAANMVDLDSDPTKILEVVEIGKQLLITRGSLTTFSIANDIAKYFAIIPAMFMKSIPQLAVLNIMHLSTEYSAILSALIFNAIIIPCLIPLAMKGVKYRPLSSGKMLVRNMMIYGMGGVIAPFVGIKLIDTMITPVLLAMGI